VSLPQRTPSIAAVRAPGFSFAVRHGYAVQQVEPDAPASSAAERRRRIEFVGFLVPALMPAARRCPRGWLGILELVASALHARGLGEITSVQLRAWQPRPHQIAQALDTAPDRARLQAADEIILWGKALSRVVCTRDGTIGATMSSAKTKCLPLSAAAQADAKRAIEIGIDPIAYLGIFPKQRGTGERLAEYVQAVRAEARADARRAALLEALCFLRARERSAVAASNNGMPISAHGALLRLAEQIASLIDPDWNADDPYRLPFALLRAGHARIPQAA